MLPAYKGSFWAHVQQSQTNRRVKTTFAEVMLSTQVLETIINIPPPTCSRIQSVEIRACECESVAHMGSDAFNCYSNWENSHGK